MIGPCGFELMSKLFDRLCLSCEALGAACTENEETGGCGAEASDHPNYAFHNVDLLP